MSELDASISELSGSHARTASKSRRGSALLSDQRLIVAVSVWAVTRISLVVSLVIPAELLGAGDIARYSAIADALLSGSPVRIFEYPIGALGVILPAAIAGTTYTTYLITFVALAVALDFLALAGILGATGGESWNLRGGWLWILGVPALGVLSVTRLDVAACSLAALGVAGLQRRRWTSGVGSVLMLGALVKVWPGIILITMVGSASRRSGRIVLGALGTAFVAILMAMAAGLSPLLPDFLTYQRDRGLQIEAFATLPLLWLDQLGIATYTGRFAFGSQQIVGPGTETIARLCTPAMLIGLSMVAAMVWRLKREGALTSSHVTLISTAALLVLITTNKVFSPQYMLWVLVMYALMSHSRDAVPPMSYYVLLGATILTHVLFPYLYAELVERQFLPLLVLTLRNGLVLLLLVDLVRRLGAMSRTRTTEELASA